MGLLDLFRRQGATDAAAAAGPGEPVEVARSRARRRLIGAVVLLGIGVIAFPLLFETQPRPIPVDIPIQIPAREGAAPLAMPAPRAASAPQAVASVPASPTLAASAAPQPAASSEARVEAPRVPPAVAPAPVEAAPASAPKAQPAPAKPAPPAAKPEPAPKPGAEAPGRFVVQVGAFAEAATVREARGKLERLGLPSYTQVVDTASGSRTRVRLGPYGTREEADKAAAKAKSVGLAGTVLAL